MMLVHFFTQNAQLIARSWEHYGALEGWALGITVVSFIAAIVISIQVSHEHVGGKVVKFPTAEQTSHLHHRLGS